MIKLIIADMDGTLIDRDEVLSNKALDIIKKVKEQGVLFTIATGRVESMVANYVKKMNIDIPYIACNGATIMHGERVIQRKTIPALGLREIITQADEIGMSIIYTIEGNEFVFRTTSWIEKQRQEFNRYYNVQPFSEKDWENLLIDKVTIMDDIRDGRIGLIEELCMGLPTEYSFTRYTDKAVEIVDNQSNKGNSLKYLTKILGISLDEVMAIGDHQNDIEMLKVSGLGVAVSNAIESAKNEADYVCSERCVDGVIEAIEKFVLKN